ncbi:MAG TPA: xanthine dehydrogenase family protein subunit M, partial [Actinomycetota bacterium]|nr:xanthine dehydrogenase family protein subunit M [Actinomycetota bacterium]
AGMLPSRFEYHRPATLQEALQALSSLEDAKVLAGGQSLIPVMKLRFAAPANLVDINRIPGLDAIEDDGGGLRIGALVRHNQMAASEVVDARFPLLASAAPQIADPLVRNLGSVGGSLAHADPAGDWGSVMLAASASVVLRSSRGERELPVREFLVDIFTTALEPDELLTEVRVPAPGGKVGGSYLKLERKVGDFATVGVAVQVEMSNGTIDRAGIGLTGVGTKNVEATEAQGSLAGAEPTEEAFAEAGRLAAVAASPSSDVRGSAEYKRHMVDVYVRRGLAHAVEMARA